MTGADAKLGAAKRRILALARERGLDVSVGIGLVGDGPGLVVSVQTGRADAVRALVRGLELAVPTTVRRIGPIKKRSGR